MPTLFVFSLTWGAFIGVCMVVVWFAPRKSGATDRTWSAFWGYLLASPATTMFVTMFYNDATTQVERVHFLATRVMLSVSASAVVFIVVSVVVLVARRIRASKTA